MKNKELKLYNKYKNDYHQNIELIYIGMDVDKCYWFIYKSEYFNINVNYLNKYGLNSEQIIKDLNLEIFIYNNGYKYIKEYDWYCFNKGNLINFKPMLKDKLKNILNR